jgi:hypothetical protein
VDNVRKSGCDKAAKGFTKAKYGASKGFEMRSRVWKLLRGRGRYIPELRLVSLIPQVAADMRAEL